MNADFDNPAPIAELNTAKTDSRMRLTPDGLTAYWGSGRDSAFQEDTLFTATRTTTTGAFGGIVPVFPTATTKGRYDPSPAANNLLLLFTGVNEDAGAGGYDIFTATRAATNTSFTGVTPLPIVNGPADEDTPYLLPDGSALYFASTRSDDGGIGVTEHIYVSRSTNGTFAAPTRIDALVTAGGEGNPVVSADELTIYFEDKASGDIHVAKRATKTDPFGQAVPVTALNSTANDFPSWISPDGCEIYLTSTRPGTGGYDLYRAARKKP